jgi:hypothetical protein
MLHKIPCSYYVYSVDAEEGGGSTLGLGDLVLHADPKTDPYLLDPNAGSDDDSDVEDLEVKPTDNLMLVGHVEGNAAILEVYGNIVLCFLTVFVISCGLFRRDSSVQRRGGCLVRSPRHHPSFLPLGLGVAQL